jgi:hypothetical protein
MNSPTQQSDDRRFMELLNRLIPFDAIVETLAALLSATTVMKNGVVVPDWSIRFEAVRLVLAYKIGLPTPRREIVVVQQNGDKEYDLIQRMANTPSLLASVKWMVAQAEARKLARTAEAANRDGTYS